jgi:hypothetical protein
MTYYKYSHFLMYEDGPEYETAFKAGTAAPFSGIYYCEICGCSITSMRSQPLPSQEHHPHSPKQGLVRWRLGVKSQYG